MAQLEKAKRAENIPVLSGRLVSCSPCVKWAQNINLQTCGFDAHQRIDTANSNRFSELAAAQNFSANEFRKIATFTPVKLIQFQNFFFQQLN